MPPEDITPTAKPEEAAPFDVTTVGLPKWSPMVVRGKPVTPDQAAEIIVRTSGLDFFANDKDWIRQLSEAADMIYQDYRTDLDWQAIDERAATARARYRVLTLENLQNRQIASSWIGGPHGWCGWSGSIGCNNYNLGKYPDPPEILKEWQTIATAFPYLDLRCQLFDDEERDVAKPAIEYVIRDGEVMAVKPEGPLDVPSFPGTMSVIARLTNPTAERGCTIEEFRAALMIAEGVTP